MNFIKIAGVLKKTSTSRSTLLRWLKEPEIGFPQPVKLGGINYWIDEQIEAWMQTQAEAAQRAAVELQQQVGGAA
ncbi:helix-turn-helix transcriptional regulator [Diaphorobacter nitroreducens]|uniref:helix-turn-helix transcriptional regulator n=1 Tax=Diaphorobacter nitroreducens TaxID=164759 RepID=UPI0024E1F31D|nr:AlpA family phage regulatory protein [Diaphorobacter nitroreducens]